MSCTGSVRLDLTVEPGILDSSDRRTLTELDNMPDGARVIVDIGSRKWVTTDAVIFLHKHADRLLIEISGASTEATRVWVAAVRSGVSWGAVV